MIKILSLLVSLILVAVCADSHAADPHHATVNASVRGDHEEAAKNLLLSAEQREKDWLFEIPTSYTYCLAASEFLKAGGADNVRNSIGSATKGVVKSRVLAEKYRASKFGQKFLRATKNMFVCKLILAQGRLFNGDHEGVKELVKDYTGLEAEPAWFVFDDKVDDPDYDNFGANLVRLLQSQNSELAVAVEKHFRSSSMAVTEQQKRDEVTWKARETEQARVEAIKREQAAREATLKREREAQKVAAQAEYERQHPEITRAREAKVAAQEQCAQCKSSCDDQTYHCTLACAGNPADSMCIARCQVAVDTCKNGCEEQRDALIVQAGGTPLGTSSSGTTALLQGLVVIGDSLAAQQKQKALANPPIASTPRSMPAPSMTMPSMAQRTEPLRDAQRSTVPSVSTIAPLNQHNPANEAARCISIDRSNQQLYGVRFVNICSYSIEITWCANTKRDPRNCDAGYDSFSGIAPGGSWPIDSLDKALSWEYGACRKGTMYNTTEMSGRKEYRCVDR